MWREKMTKPENIKGMAYYRQSARNCQEKSIPMQQEQVKKYAAEHGIDIIREFTDSDRFKLLFEGGESFKKIVEMMVDSFGEFDCALLLNPSKWGRCKNIGPSEYHHVVFKEHCKIVMFCISFCECKNR
jgi:hypothetical protein